MTRASRRGGRSQISAAARGEPALPAGVPLFLIRWADNTVSWIRGLGRHQALLLLDYLLPALRRLRQDLLSSGDGVPEPESEGTDEPDVRRRRVFAYTPSVSV